jgi:hypothetical protein
MSTDPALLNKPSRQTFVVADLKCYLCGTVCGSIEREQSPTPMRGASSPVALRRPGEQHASLVSDWRHLRCDRCGGPFFLDETDVVVRRTEDDYNWTDERPRRGRPPKRLVEQRRRERELLDPQAA